MRVKVKICGITNQRDAAAAIAAGADALGFVFWAASPRAVSVTAAADISASLPPFVARVGVFVDPEPEYLRRAVSEAGLDVVQLHGDELEQTCLSAGRPYIKAFRVNAPFDAAAAADRYPSAAAFLLDSDRAGFKGGTGVAFDWHFWPPVSAKPLILAGGLTPANVADAIGRLRPYAVDVSGGVEGGIKGCKDADRMAQFVDAVHRRR
jgi:phosphoribosylanthranilate isomerase